MSKERELLQKVIQDVDDGVMSLYLYKEVMDYLAQPEQTEQAPVAWITEWVQRYRYNATAITDRAVSFTKGGAPAVPNPKYIPLYLAPPKREPLSEQEPVAWIDPENYKQVIANPYGALRYLTRTPNDGDIPFYASPQKREPLSDTRCPYPEETSGEYRDGFTDGILYAEKAHGITGVEE